MIRGTTRVAAVLGWPIDHSRSPQIMNAAFAAAGVDAVLVPMAVPPDRLTTVVEGLRVIRALGASVTIPHKLGAHALCDEVSPAAVTIGAVNCLQFTEGGRLVGHNTDAEGFADGLAATGFDVRGKRIVMLGAGGSARAVAYGVRAAQEIEIVARRPAEVTWASARQWTEEHLRGAFADADLVIDCTSAGLAESGELAFVDALPLDVLPPRAVVASLVYHRRVLLLERAAGRGHSTLDGKAMLVHQAARAFAIWTGQAASIEVMTRALADDLRGM